MGETAEKSSIELEFEEINSKKLWGTVYEKIRTVSNSYGYTSDDAKKSENRHLNRYRDVIPYDHSRIGLVRCSTDYVNANLVEIEQANRKYILTQGPLPNTIAHFWAMVWEQNCKAIVMLNKIIEKNQLKCSQYWPSSSESDLEFPDVKLSVHLDSQVNHSYYITRNLRVTDKETSEERHVILFHYTTWPDFGVPQSPTALLRFIRAVRKSGALEESQGPPIVHCSAGIGRSGTFILVDCVLKLLSDKQVETVSVQEILLEMRHYRMGLIQTPDQLRFSYQAIIEGIRTDWETDVEVRHLEDEDKLGIGAKFVNEENLRIEDRTRFQNTRDFILRINANQRNQKTSHYFETLKKSRVQTSVNKIKNHIKLNLPEVRKFKINGESSLKTKNDLEYHRLEMSDNSDYRFQKGFEWRFKTNKNSTVERDDNSPIGDEIEFKLKTPNVSYSYSVL